MFECGGARVRRCQSMTSLGTPCVALSQSGRSLAYSLRSPSPDRLGFHSAQREFSERNHLRTTHDSIQMSTELVRSREKRFLKRVFYCYCTLAANRPLRSLRRQAFLVTCRTSYLCRRTVAPAAPADEVRQPCATCSPSLSEA